MDYLLIYAHPNPKSFNYAIRECVEAQLRQRGKDFQVRDLYTLKFNPLLSAEDFSLISDGKTGADIQVEQEYVRQADTLIFISPIWWFSMPAVMKGYIDRVFSHGFAFRYTKKGVEGLLRGKNAVILNTTGGPEKNYLSGGYGAALKQTTDTGIFEFCGIDVVWHKYFYAVPYISAAERAAMLEEIRGISW